MQNESKFRITCNRTFDVSIGIVKNSAKQAAVPAAAMVFKVYLNFETDVVSTITAVCFCLLAILPQLQYCKIK